MPDETPEHPAFSARPRLLPAAATGTEGVAADTGARLSELLATGASASRCVVLGDLHGGAARPACGAAPSDPAFDTGSLAARRSRRPVAAQEPAHV